ncbi:MULTISPECIES: aldo/keto reductase [unclassified Bradyrhizobium]|uniref:aldo/keto reductase n=1 Tax=unclassified Bradyrhizobium TaxID=2631580 RepID=UPI0028E83D1F|nr:MULTISPECIES: aldo/keto reductase [unclassified Bradyrhizobium]
MHTVKANGATIPAIGLGTWKLKGTEGSELVAHALVDGYRHIDTASACENEEAVGAGLRASGVPREQVFITTKVWWTDIAAVDLERSAEASLRRLGLDQVDLLLLHWPNPGIPLKESIAALNQAKVRGLTRHIGVSNFTTDLLRQAVSLSEAPLTCNQVEYHPYIDQRKVLAANRAFGVATVSYCPLYRGRGLLEVPAIVAAAKRHSKTPGQIVLRWHVQQKGVVPIPRTSRKERLAENAAIFDFTLSGEEMAQISALSRGQSRICNPDFSPQWDEP